MRSSVQRDIVLPGEFLTLRVFLVHSQLE
jgi:hypothetical protein